MADFIDKKCRIVEAKDNDEPACVEAFNCEAARNGPYADAVQVRADNVKLDTNYHTDVRVRRLFPDGTHMTCNVDVKAALGRNLHTGNYTIRRPCAEYISKERSDTFLFAFRLAENGRKIKRFVVMSAKDVVSTLDFSKNDKYFMVSLADLQARIPYDVIESDLPE